MSSRSNWHLLRPVITLSLMITPLAAFAWGLGGPNGLLLGFIAVGGLILLGHYQAELLLRGAHVLQEFHASSNAELGALLDELAKNAGLAPPRLCIITHAEPNAWTIGLAPGSSTIVVTSALLSALTINELAGVLAHELAHIRSRDTLIMTIAAAVAVIVTAIATLLLLIGRSMGRRNGFVVQIVAALAAVSTALVALALSREREYWADRVGAKICGHPEWLIAALRKLGRSRARPVASSALHPALAALRFVNAEGWMSVLLSAHPPIASRIARLTRLRKPHH